MKLSDLIERLGGTLAQGSPDHRLRGVTSPSRAGANDIVFAEDSASAEDALASKAGAVVLRKGLVGSYPAAKCVVETPQPRLWFARAAKLLKPALPVGGVHPSAVIGSKVQLGEDVTIGPCAVIEDNAHVGARTRIEAGAVIGRCVDIGDYCHIHPRAVLYPGTTLGNWVVVHAGAVLGADGFGYVRNPQNGAYTQFPQQGTLVIEDEVEIGANTTIDRGALAETRIRRGVKIDNLVHVGHNCDIGEDVILVALTGISGSSTVGKSAVLAGQVGIGDHAHVAPGVILGGQSGVFNGKTAAAEPGTVLYGTPARPLKQVLREQAVLARLAKRSKPSDRSN
ncbi:UDP-3-O-(3-hydroxymyristoyl)glucosamine N-acyltransferase [Occallatibacter riparius]|uniref:UDP-3-O-acylglucosamine N-acyltransferase n=1 Tax=Occallatibacter riparius TaxID=1002689 RepID=A0A9J7BIG2_9BACT|nr:UDP-3-O-(3-hydroxymyristoyl)glucosamine N-acyltransferase [Occallatibacter riparius]UWZ82724.1 UDP-3-O-(3-hydroxymyristoyl)glucosamine N-acyltransferase [Occallatibacter riparius]